MAQTHAEKITMYMKLTKRELAEMLAEQLAPRHYSASGPLSYPLTQQIPCGTRDPMPQHTFGIGGNPFSTFRGAALY